MIRVTDYRQSKHHLSDYLPWAALVAPSIILQKDGILQSTFQVWGHNFLGFTSEFIDTIISSANNMCMYLDSGWTMCMEATRNVLTCYPQSSWNNETAKKIDEERCEYYKSHHLFEMSYYITFCYKERETKGAVSKFFSENNGHSLSSELDAFQKKIMDLKGLLQECFLRVQLLDDNQTLTYLHSCVSHTHHTVLAPPTTMYLDAFITDESLTIEETLKLGTHYLGVISVHDFPHATRANILEELQTLPIDFRWQTRMLFADEQQAIRDIKKYRRKHYAQRKSMLKAVQEKQSGESGLDNTEAIMKALDADEALELAGKNLVRFGYLTSVVVVSDIDIKTLNDKISMVKEVFQKKGFIVKSERLNAMDAWLSSLPGHVYSNVRRALVHSVNFAHMLPLSSKWCGNVENSHLKKVCGHGSPHILANMKSNVFYLNLNYKDVGHTLIIGPTGAGKSTILGLLCAQFLRYPNAQVIIFDKDFSALPLTKKIGGSYYAPGAADNTIAFQPFLHINQKSELQWALQYCSLILELHNIPLSGDVLQELKKTLSLLADIPKHKRTISSFCEIMQTKSLVQVFSKYCGSDIFGALFDGVESEIATLSNWMMFEMGYLIKLGKHAIMPALYYLFHKVENTFNGDPTLLVLDEGWLFLQHETFADQFKIWLKTLRKKNVFVVMATQEIADAVRSPLLETIISACATRIYLPDKSANQTYMKELYFNFGLNEREIDILANAQSKKEYYITSNECKSLISLDLGTKTLEILTKKIVANNNLKKEVVV